VAGHIFQARPVWIYTQSNITNIKFNEYFVNVGPELAKKITENDGQKTFEHYLTSNLYKDSMFLEVITKNEIELEISNMNQNKSPGYDNITSKFIKLTATNISEPLAHIFNLTFLSGIIPDEIKIALVTPIFKANEKSEFNNYRPISVLSCFSKLLEKLMYKRLINFIEKNKILSKTSIWV
jgi:hypothetical protein